MLARYSFVPVAESSMASASSAACQATSMTYKIRENWKKRHERERAASFDAAHPGVCPHQLAPVPETPNAAIPASLSSAPAQCPNTETPPVINSSTEAIPLQQHTALVEPVPLLPDLPLVAPRVPPQEVTAPVDSIKTSSTGSLTSMLLDKLNSFTGRKRHVSGDNPPTTSLNPPATDISFPRRRHHSDSSHLNSHDKNAVDY